MDKCFPITSPYKNDNFYIVMDNDSGYDSRHIDTGSVESLFNTSTNSTIEILKSFIPKTDSVIPLSEDALLEKPITKDQYFDFQKENISPAKSYEEVVSSSVISETSSLNLSQFAESCTSSVASEIIPLRSQIEVNFNDLNIMSNISRNYEESPLKGFVNENSYANMENIPRKTDLKSPFKLLKRNDSLVENKSVTIKPVLSNVTNTFENVKTKALNLQNVPNCSNKENRCLGPQRTPVKKIIAQADDECLSPDLFENEEKLLKSSPKEQVSVEKYATQEDQKLLRKIQQGLSGVPPPPNTFCRLTVEHILEKLESNKKYFWFNEDNTTDSGISFSGSTSSSLNPKTLLINGSHNDTNEKFPQILSTRYHGLHHNRSKVSEELEHLCEKYGRRYISAETQSTFTVFDVKSSSGTPSKLKASKLLTKSPGRRLSHLARRRITFSSANLQSNKSVVINYNKSSRNLIAPKPPHKSPLKSSGSAKKNIEHRFRLLSGSSDSGASTSSGATIAKKALFQSPIKNSNDENIGNKRKRPDYETTGPNKMFKSSSSMISLKEAEINNRLSLTNNMIGSQPWSNSQSEMTEAFKKKLQWAVYEALKQQDVTTVHNQFKQYATLLARVTRRFVFSSSQGQKDAKIERLLKIARHFAFSVVRGKTLEEMERDSAKSRAKTQKPQGYVAPENRESASGSSNYNKENSHSDTKDSSFTTKRNKPAPHIENRIDRIRKVINFEGGR